MNRLFPSGIRTNIISKKYIGEIWLVMPERLSLHIMFVVSAILLMCLILLNAIHASTVFVDIKKLWERFEPYYSGIQIAIDDAGAESDVEIVGGMFAEDVYVT